MNLKVAQFLLVNGACPNHFNYCHGQTPLHVATLCEHLDFVKFLLAEDVDIDFKDIDRNTPLYYAVEQENIEIVTLLIKNGANIREKCKNKQSPFDLVKSRKDKDLDLYLELMVPFEKRLSELQTLSDLKVEDEKKSRMITEANKKITKLEQSHKIALADVNKQHSIAVTNAEKVQAKLQRRIDHLEKQLEQKETEFEKRVDELETLADLNAENEKKFKTIVDLNKKLAKLEEANELAMAEAREHSIAASNAKKVQSILEGKIGNLEQHIEDLNLEYLLKDLHKDLRQKKSQRKFALFVRDNILKESAEMEEYVKQLDAKIRYLTAEHANLGHGDKICNLNDSNYDTIRPDFTRLKTDVLAMKDSLLQEMQPSDANGSNVDPLENTEFKDEKAKTIAIIKHIRQMFPERSDDEIYRNIKSIKEKHDNSLKNLTVDQIVSQISDIRPEIGKSKKTLQKLSFISIMKFFLLISDEECCICQEDLYSEPTRKLNCNHEFHRDCIGDWFKQQKNCPICRSGPTRGPFRGRRGGQSRGRGRSTYA